MLRTIYVKGYCKNDILKNAYVNYQYKYTHLKNEKLVQSCAVCLHLKV